MDIPAARKVIIKAWQENADKEHALALALKDKELVIKDKELVIKDQELVQALAELTLARVQSELMTTKVAYMVATGKLNMRGVMGE